jgi:hypothetical protein
VRVYTPPAAAEGKKLPIGVYYHGGGYLVGNLDSEDAWCRVIAKNTPCIIVSVDYRLSTSHKLPVMLEDSVVASKWVSYPLFPSSFPFSLSILEFVVYVNDTDFCRLGTMLINSAATKPNSSLLAPPQAAA